MIRLKSPKATDKIIYSYPDAKWTSRKESCFVDGYAGSRETLCADGKPIIAIEIANCRAKARVYDVRTSQAA